jgi:hypothetical protein
MAKDSRTIDEIEREIELERAALRRDLDRLVNKFTFEDVWRRVGKRIDRDPQALGHILKRMVREKPFAVALTGIGLAWLAFGPKQNDLSEERAADRYYANPRVTLQRSPVRKRIADHSSATLDGTATTRETAPASGGTSQKTPGTASGTGWDVSADKAAAERVSGNGPRPTASGTAPSTKPTTAQGPGGS